MLKITFMPILLVAIVWCPLHGEDKIPYWDQLFKVTNEDHKAAVASIEALGRSKDPKAVPLLYMMFMKLGRENCGIYDPPSQAPSLHQALLDAILEIGGDSGRHYGRKIIDAFVKEAGLSSFRKFPSWQIIEYSSVTQEFFHNYATIISKEDAGWALSIANDESIGYYHARESAFFCYLTAMTIDLKEADKKVEFILKDYSSPGNDYVWEERHLELDGSVSRSFVGMPTTIGIKNNARRKFLIGMGPSALPALKQAWKDLMDKREHTSKDDLRQWGLACALNYIINQVNEAKTPVVYYPFGAAYKTSDQKIELSKEWEKKRLEWIKTLPKKNNN